MLIGNIPKAYPLFLKGDTVDHLKWIAKTLGRQRNADVSVSEAVEYLVSRHWMKTQKRIMEKRAERALAARAG
jgi:hypothetical protein